MPTGRSPRVSLVIPVYDPGPYLRPCLESVLAQDLAEDELEVVAVDDGSTDGSGEILDAYADRRPGWRVIHQENSGWPGRPRNVGLGACTGRYVFFLDADDYLGPEALRRLADFADAHGSDVVVPRMVGVGGRDVPDAVYASTEVDADRVAVFQTLGPMKLFRRAFLEEHGLRFPEGRVRLEDGMLVARAYLLARRVSVLGDYDAYFLRTREDGLNISMRLGDAAGYTGSVATLIDIVREHARDPMLAEAVALDLYRRKALKHFVPQRMPLHRPKRLRAWARTVRELAETRIPEQLERRLAFDERLRSRFVRHGDLRALRALTRLQAAGRQPRALRRGGRLLLDLPSRTGEAALDVTGDVGLAATLRRLRLGRDHVDVFGAARITDVRVRGRLRLRLAVEVEGGPTGPVVRVVAPAEPGTRWRHFSARVPLPEAPPGRARHIVVRHRLSARHELVARLASLPPADAARPHDRSPRRLLERWSRRPELTPLRAGAARALRATPGAARAYRALRRRPGAPR